MLIFTLFGGLRVARGEKPRGDAVEVTGFVSQKARALLAYLALNPRPHARETLAGLLWGERSQQRAAGNLRVILSNLRELFPDHLCINRATVAFDARAPYRLDVANFETLLAIGDPASLQQAVALYHGPLLEGCYLRDAPAFEEWLLVERERLHQAQLQALHRLTHYHTERGAYAAAIELAGRLLALDPWREETHRELMRLLALTGQRGAALAQYERCRRILREELGLEPLEETTALYLRIQAEQEHRPSLPHPLTHSPTLPFAGRGDEHARVLAWWERVRGGGGPLLLVEGEAGVGKTRLLAEALHAIASRGATVLRGRCYEFGGGLPYQPVAEALRTYLHTHSLPHTLEPVWQVELTRLLPELGAPASAGRGTAGESVRPRLFEAVAQFLGAVAPAPLVLFLDDLHWADSSTLDLLHYLVCCAPPGALSLVGAYRPEELTPGHPLVRLRQSLSRDHQVERLRLERLPAEAVAEWGHALVGSADGAALGAWLYQESEGNPFILTEMVYTLQEQGALQSGVDGAWTWQHPPAAVGLSTGVQDVILQRVERLSAPAQQLLTLAAVIGRQFDAALLQAAAAAAPPAVEMTIAPIVEEWLARHLVQHPASSDQYDFTHDKIRATLYHTIPALARPALHRQVAGSLEQVSGGREVGALAYHWEQAAAGGAAADVMRATEYLLRAGDQARLLYAVQEASDYYRRALGFLEQGGDLERAARTWMSLGLTYHNAFDFAQAREAYAAGFALWQKLPADAQPVSPAHALRVRWEEPRSLDPVLAPDAHTSELMAHLFSGLVDINADLAVTPDVAQHWEIADDGCALIFHLRPEACWSDGAPVTAEDFVYAWRRALEPGNGLLTIGSMAEIVGAEAFHQGAAPWEDVGVRACDPLTLEVRLQEPSGYFLYLLAHTPYYPVPRHVVGAHGAAWCAPEHFVSNGPFTLERWEKGRCLVLQRHAGYHGTWTGNLARVELHVLQEPSVRLAWYAADKLDVLGITHFPADEQARARQCYGDQYLSAPRLSTCYLVFDVGQAPFADTRVRQALALATDREALADGILQGHVAPATGGLIPQGMPGYAPGLALPYAPEQARQLLAQAGYPGGAGFPRVRAMAFRAVEARVAYLQAQWREQLGIDIAWEVLEWGEFLAQLRQSPPALFPAIWTADYPDPDDFLRVSRHDHWSSWQHVEYDALVVQARNDLDQAARLARYVEAEHILASEAPVLPLTYERDHLLLKPWVRRYPIAGNRAMFWKDVLLAARED